MKTLMQRMIAIVLIAVLIIPIGFALLKIAYLGGGMEVLEGPFSYVNGFLVAHQTGQRYDLSPWIHLNGSIDVLEEPVRHTLGKITYEFYLKDVHHPVMKFEEGNTQYQVYEQKGNIVVKRLTGWPFHRISTVCALPNEECFYTPVEVSGIKECAILVLDSDPGRENSSIALWARQEDTWVQIPFVKDGETYLELQGTVRRHPNYFGKKDPETGKIEFCWQEAEGAKLYSANFENGEIILTPKETLTEDEWDEWMF